MAKVCFGVDPDSEAHGVARYFDGKLEYLDDLPLIALIDYIKSFVSDGDEVLVSMENVMANKFVYGRNAHSSKAAESQIAMRVGRCQQAQVEIERQLKHYGIPYELHPPQNGNWAKNKPLFERITGWKGKSNEDQRAAAYFGFLAVDRQNRSSKHTGLKNTIAGT